MSGRLDCIPPGTRSLHSGISQRERARLKATPRPTLHRQPLRRGPWSFHRSPFAVEFLSPVAADALGSPTGEEALGSLSHTRRLGGAPSEQSPRDEKWRASRTATTC